MPTVIDITGQRFNRLIVIKRARNASDRHARWRCRCDCGRHVVVYGASLRSGRSKSCGCRQREVARIVNTTHGHSVERKLTPTYRSWRNMHTRCINPNFKKYADYGGRGITISKRWIGPNGFKHFLADMGERPLGKTLDRKDSNKNYTPSNCRWATPSEQGTNRRKRRN
jgi:hypothetical protein